MDPSRSVLIRYTRDGESRRGSGLRVGGRFVLTADHCANGTGHRLVVGGQEYQATVHVRSNVEAVDVAILIADNLPELASLRCALVNRGVDQDLDGCRALGFPSWKLNPLGDRNSATPVLARTRGTVPTAEGIDPYGKTVDLLSFKITDPEAQGHAVPRGELDQPKSKWAGMSGSGVVTLDDLLVGVIRSHTLEEGGSSLTITPLDTISILPPQTAGLFWAALGVTDPAALPRLPLPPETTPALDVSVGQVVVGTIPQQPLGHVTRDTMDDLAQASDKRAPRSPGTRLTVSNLPTRNRNFTGREHLLDVLHSKLQSQAQQHVAAVLPIEAVHELGGVGKTELTLEFAYRYAEEYDIVWWIPAEQDVTARAALARLALRLGIDDRPDRSDLISALFERLRGTHKWLLIYDNAEEPASILDLLPPGGGGRVLITSRWAAWGRYADELRVAVPARDDTIRFLQKRLGETDRTQLNELAELLGDLPLALEESAAYLEQTRESLIDYLDLLRERFRELFGLTIAETAVISDHQRVSTVWSVSLDRLVKEAPAAQSLMNLCSFLGTDIPRDLPTKYSDLLPNELAFAAGDKLVYNRTLATMGRYSLVTLTDRSIEVHRLVQAVIQARLGESNERSWAKTTIALLIGSFPANIEEPGEWPTCERLLPHILVAVGHAERLHTARVEASSLLERAGYYFSQSGQYQQAKPLFVRALTLGEAALGPRNPSVAMIRGNLGNVLVELGELEDAYIQLKLALEISEAALGPDHTEVAVRRSSLGLLLEDMGDTAGSKAQLKRALKITENALGPNDATVGRRHSNLASTLWKDGDLRGSRAHLKQALRISELALGVNHPDVGIIHNNLGNLLIESGDFDAAINEFEKAITITEDTIGPDHLNVGLLRYSLGNALYGAGDLAAARTQYRHAVQLMEPALGVKSPRVRDVKKRLRMVEEESP